MIRLTNLQDLDNVMECYQYAKKIMRNSGNLYQWVDGYPSKEIITNDINNHNSYVVIEEGKIVGVFSLILGLDKTYLKIDGNWLNDEFYGTIHRIGSNGQSQNILAKAVQFAYGKVDNVRIDTHADNKIMQHLLDKLGFSYCGIIYLENGDPRLAYQRVKDY